MSWQSSLGRMEAEEREWRKGTRRLRPFLKAAKIRPRGFSRRLQRLATDLGADEAFGKAAGKRREHHGVEVAEATLRRCVLGPARRMARQADGAGACTRLKAQGPDWIIASAEGTMLPVVRTQEAPAGADRRKHRKLAWEEMRLVAARPQGQARANYAARLGDASDAGQRWSQVAGLSGWALNTRIHAVGDGAGWIARQAQERFGASHRYTLDLYHVCEYIAAAAPEPAASKEYVAQAREALRQNRSGQVIGQWRERMEPPERPEEQAPVRQAVRHLENRRDQLDYAFAIKHGLPVGSGMIESGHRHVLQARLKRSGTWWSPQNLHDMAQLRVTRSNNLWHAYWHN